VDLIRLDTRTQHGRLLDPVGCQESEHFPLSPVYPAQPGSSEGAASEVMRLALPL
jgi:hypothetical protein